MKNLLDKDQILRRCCNYTLCNCIRRVGISKPRPDFLTELYAVEPGFM